MRRIFKQKYILRIVAFLTLALALFNALEPKISDHNWKVYEEQIRLQTEADGVEKVSYAFYGDAPTRNALTITLVALFLSLILTKRIILSFVFLLLFWLQMYLTMLIVLELDKADYYFSYPESLYFEYLITACLIALSFWMAFSACRLFSQRFQTKTFPQ